MIDKVRLFPSKSSFTDFLSASELNFGLHTDAWISWNSLKFDLLSADEAIENSRSGIKLPERDSKTVFKIGSEKYLMYYLKNFSEREYDT